MTFRHRAGVSPYTSSFDFAETCVFGKQSVGPSRCGPLELQPANGLTLLGRPFSRSYGTILPSSLTRVLSISLVCSTCPPVSVLVRARSHSLEAFLGGMGSATYGRSRSASPLGRMAPGFSWEPSYRVTRGLPTPRFAYPSPSPLRSNVEDAVQEYQPVVHRLRLSASA